VSDETADERMVSDEPDVYDLIPDELPPGVVIIAHPESGSRMGATLDSFDELFSQTGWVLESERPEPAPVPAPPDPTAPTED
jgi:hypothetical protein